MRRLVPALLLAAVLASGCGADLAAVPAAEVATVTVAPSVAFVGPSGLEVEAEQAASNAVEAQRVAVEAATQAEVDRLAAEESARQASAEAAAQAAATEAAAEQAAAQAVIDAEGGCPPGWYYGDETGCISPDDSGYEEDGGYVTTDLEVRCSDGTATIEECFGPGSDLDGNGVADVNE